VFTKFDNLKEIDSTVNNERVSKTEINGILIVVIISSAKLDCEEVSLLEFSNFRVLFDLIGVGFSLSSVGFWTKLKSFEAFLVNFK
jgi:hypothetical protein